MIFGILDPFSTENLSASESNGKKRTCIRKHYDRVETAIRVIRATEVLVEHHKVVGLRCVLFQRVVFA